MANAKLMTPLFYRDNYNAAGKKMRAVLVREVSNGTDTYRLWRRDGKPDRQYPQGEGDDYILYVELHGYLATLRTTDYYLMTVAATRPWSRPLSLIHISEPTRH